MRGLKIVAALLVSVLPPTGYAAEPKFEPGCDAGSSIKISGLVESIELTGVGGPAAQVLTIRLSDKHEYSARADASGVLAGYVALLTSAYSEKRPVTINYGCEVGIRTIHSLDMP